MVFQPTEYDYAIAHVKKCLQSAVLHVRRKKNVDHQNGHRKR